MRRDHRDAGSTRGAVYANFASEADVVVARLRCRKDDDLVTFRAAD